MLDGREKLEMWWVEEGYLTDLTSVLMVRPYHNQINYILDESSSACESTSRVISARVPNRTRK